MIAAVQLAVPLYVSIAGADSFRFPKTLILEAAGIIIVTQLALSVVMGRSLLGRRSLADPVLQVPLLIIAWTLFTSIISTNSALSNGSLRWVVCAIGIFLGTVAAAPLRFRDAIALTYVAAFINAVVLVLQDWDIWSPFQFGAEIAHPGRLTAFIGNTSDMGCYMIAPALAALALVFAARRPRPYEIAAAAFLAAGVFAGRTVTAILAYFAAAASVTLLRYGARAAAVLGMLMIAAVAFVAGYPPLRHRAISSIEFLQDRQVDFFVNGRLTPFLVAMEMFEDHPVAGVGPGCYGFQYYPYKIRVEEKYPQQLNSPLRGLNAAEAHNDHLQTLAVAGIPGYLLFLYALWRLAKLSFQQPPPTREPRLEFVRLFALPFAVMIFVVTLAQFPLELPASMAVYAYLAGLSFGWQQ